MFELRYVDVIANDSFKIEVELFLTKYRNFENFNLFAAMESFQIYLQNLSLTLSSLFFQI